MDMRTNLKLRKVGERHMLVVVSENDINTTSVYTFNDTAAFVWNAASRHGLDIDVLASLLCEEYDVSLPVALADVGRLLAEWKEAGLVG